MESIQGREGVDPGSGRSRPGVHSAEATTELALTTSLSLSRNRRRSPHPTKARELMMMMRDTPHLPIRARRAPEASGRGRAHLRSAGNRIACTPDSGRGEMESLKEDAAGAFAYLAH